MAITYKWKINQMNTHIEQFNEDNVIFTVHWGYSGSEEIDGVTYSANSIGTQSFTYTEGDPFTPYANTEAFEAIVVGWLEGELDVDSLNSSIATQISKQVTPVQEDLYFTWQDPHSND